jgi:hypothetical protein
MANARDERHRYGQHMLLAKCETTFFRGSQDGDLVLDPSCGDGRLLEEAMDLKGSSHHDFVQTATSGRSRSSALSAQRLP